MQTAHQVSLSKNKALGSQYMSTNAIFKFEATDIWAHDIETLHFMLNAAVLDFKKELEDKFKTEKVEKANASDDAKLPELPRFSQVTAPGNEDMQMWEVERAV